MKVIYLDFNHWITLSKIAIGTETKPELQQMYYFLEEKLENNEIRIPLSLTHLLELATSSKNNKRKLTLAKTMLKFSQGYTIPPYTTMLRYETDNAIIDRLFEHGNLKQQQEIQKMKRYLESVNKKSEEFIFLGKGIPHILGSTLQALNKFTGEEIQDERVNQIDNYLSTPEAFLELITTKDFQTLSNQTKHEFREIVSGYEKDAAHFSNIQKSHQNNAIKGYFLLKIGIIDIITKKYLNWCKIFNFKVNKEINLLFYHRDDNTSNQKAFNNFIENIPILDVFLSLSIYYFKHFERKITSNDLFDISFLSLAIPYSDIVICDKFYAKGSKILKLDSHYNTIIFHKLENLRNLIE